MGLCRELLTTLKTPTKLRFSLFVSVYLSLSLILFPIHLLLFFQFFSAEFAIADGVDEPAGKWPPLLGNVVVLEMEVCILVESVRSD